ncbi:MAG: PH domain-containing protein [Verrucomicrobiota bacterium]
MALERRFETVEFAAPTGTRVKIMTWLSFGIVAGFVGFNIALAFYLPRKAFWPVVLSPTVGLAVILPVWIFARIKSYQLGTGELQVLRVSRVNRFALAGLEQVEHDPQAMDGARKSIGNDGLGAITGNFKSKRLGKFEVLATDHKRTVVLRWPDHVLVVSPERPGDFVDEVRARAGLRR